MRFQGYFRIQIPKIFLQNRNRNPHRDAIWFADLDNLQDSFFKSQNDVRDMNPH